MAYVQLSTGPAGAEPRYGVGRHANIVLASLRAVACALNRELGGRE